MEYEKITNELLKKLNITIEKNYINHVIVWDNKIEVSKFEIILKRNNTTIKFDFHNSIANSWEFYEFGKKINIQKTFKYKTETIPEVNNFYDTRNKRISRIKLKKLLPTNYDIIYCCILDYSYNMYTFDDFCNEFGYDVDSIKANKIYMDCINQSIQLHKIFTDDEISLINDTLNN